MNTGKTLLLCAGMAIGNAALAAPRSFAEDVERYLATHPVTGMETYADFCRLVAQPAAAGAVDATVQPCHKARKIRFWGALEHLPLFKSWGLDAAEFDPDAAARGDYPDVIICHLDPGYSQGAVDQILDAVRHGTHFVTLQATDRWSGTLAKRLGYTYGGVLTVPEMNRGGVFFKNCPRLFAGFPEGRLDAPPFSFVGKNRHGMFLTGDRCLLGVADTHTGRIATSIAQYAYGKGAVTLVGPCVNSGTAKDMDNPAYKRLLLNLVDLMPPVVREKPYDVLLYTRWMWHRDPKTGAVAPKGSYHHFSTETGAGEMARYFTSKGLTVKVTDDPGVFLTAAFRACPRMVFACANEEQFENEAQREAFYAWAKAGGGTLVLHSASNCEIGRREWRDFLGGTFLFHYPKQMPVPFADAVDKSNPAIACMPAGYVWPREEIYVNEMVPGAVKPVLNFRADTAPDEMKKWIKARGHAPADGMHVLEWTKDYGKGRVYYSALGHNADSFSKPEFLEHLYQACMWTSAKRNAPGMPFVYHPTPPEGKPYFDLLVPGSADEFLTRARPKDHVWHLGFFFSWKYINGRNFWEPHDKGAVNRVVSHSEAPVPDGALFKSEISYELDGRVILREHRTVKAYVKPDGDYSFDWTGRFEALEDLAFTSSIPKWDKAKGVNNYRGYAGFSMRLAGNDSFSYAFTNAVGSVNQRGYGDVSPRIDVYAKSKVTGNTTRLSFIADRPTPNYTLHEPKSNKGAGFYFVAFPEMFNTTLKMSKGEKRDFHYVLEVANGGS